MCGIAGFACAGPLFQTNPVQTLKAMTDAIGMRGPDADGQKVLEDLNVALGHRRLSIVELSEAGAQPMQSHSGRFEITYNGEIYNAPELRATIADKVWRGGSDTETLLELIEEGGLDAALSAVDGMFAFALFDHSNRTLTLVRDRFGEKPLYWAWINNQLVFASQLHAFHKVPGFRPEIDITAQASYFKYSYVPDPLSIFQGVHKLPPACLLQINLEAPDQNALPRPYWSAAKAARSAPAFHGSFDEAKSQLQGHLRLSVKRRLMSDVPLGAFLSGGIDSSLATAVMQEASAEPVKTFTIGMPVKGFNEADHARAVAAHLGTDHTDLMLSEQDIQSGIQNIAAVYDEPFSDSSQIPTYLVSQMAREFVTVAVSGDGADELFGGYNRHIHGGSVWKKSNSLPAPLRRLAGSMVSNLPAGPVSKLLNLMGSNELASGRADEKLKKLARTLNARSEAEFLDMLMTTGWQIEQALNLSEQPVTLDAAFTGDFTQTAMLYDTTTYLPGDILTKTDRASMAVGLELRTPYLNHELYDFAWSLPMDMKIKDGTGKILMRELLYQYVPKDLVDRPKAGFAIPLGRWFRGPLKEWVGDMLSPERLSSRGIYNTRYISNCLSDHLSGRADHESFLWSILVFESWESSLERGLV